MMSIDEAIAKYKEITNTDANCPAHCNISCDKCVQESGQIAEWLEELKQLRENANGYNKETIELNRNAMYNKAIDEFSERLKQKNKVFDISNRMIDELAEQLKAGARE